MVSLLPAAALMNLNNTRNSLLILLLAAVLSGLIGSCTATQKPDVTGNENEIEQYMQSGFQAYDSNDYDLAQIYFDSAQLLVNEHTDTAKRVKLLFNQTEILKLKGEYDTCLTNYFEAARLSKITSDSSRFALSLYNISCIQYYLGKYQACLNYADSAQALYIALHNDSRVADCYTMMGIAMRKLKSPESLDYLELALHTYEKTEDEENIAIAYNNIANHLTDMGQYAEAADYYHRAVGIQNHGRDDYNLAISLGNYGESLIDVHRFDEARLHIDSSLRMSRRLESKESIEMNFLRLRNYFDAIGSLDSALVMMDSLLEARTRRLEIEGDVLVNTMDKQHKSALSLVESKAEIDHLESARSQAQLILWFIAGISLLLIAGALIIIRKQRQIRAIDRDLHEKEKQAFEAEKALQAHVLQQRETDEQRLRDELEFKRQELIKLSLNVTEREHLLNRLRELASRLEPGEHQTPEQIREIRSLLNNMQDNGKTELNRQIYEINHSFVFQLKSRFPKLSEDDIRLASLLLLDLSSKEIADILCIEAKSVDMKRYRLKKKLEIASDVDLKDFLSGI